MGGDFVVLAPIRAVGALGGALVCGLGEFLFGFFEFLRL